VRLLLVHPSPLLYSELFLRLEPLGLERVAGAAREAGHDVRIVDLQVLPQAQLTRELAGFQPEAVGISLNYLANIPEALGICAAAKSAVPGCFVFLGGHSVSFIAQDVLSQGRGNVDAVVRGEGETAIGPLLDAIRDGGLDTVPGIVTAQGRGPAPQAMHGIDSPRPARDLMRHRRRYFIGELDPCASSAATSPGARPISPACCGGSTRSTTPDGSTPTTSAPSTTSYRFRRSRSLIRLTGASCTCTPGRPRPTSREHDPVTRSCPAPTRALRMRSRRPVMIRLPPAETRYPRARASAPTAGQPTIRAPGSQRPALAARPGRAGTGRGSGPGSAPPARTRSGTRSPG
jgi:B12 binding domain